MLTAGIEQFLDLGAGLGGVRPVHELAQAEQPQARVVYVDRDPLAVASLELIVHAADEPAPTRVAHADQEVRNIEHARHVVSLFKKGEVGEGLIEPVTTAGTNNTDPHAHEPFTTAVPWQIHPNGDTAPGAST